MKNQFLPLVILALILLAGCNSQHKSDEVASYKYNEEEVKMSDVLKKKVPDWVTEGKICYGTIVQIDKDKKLIAGKPIKAKVVQIKSDAVVMKALENISMVDVKGCSKMGLRRGDIWNEKDGDLYLTRQDAINSLIKLGIYKSTDKVTVN